jgi:hypothetical protein
MLAESKMWVRLSPIGTKRTNRVGLALSVVRGRSEVADDGGNDANDTHSDIGPHARRMAATRSFDKRSHF